MNIRELVNGGNIWCKSLTNYSLVSLKIIVFVSV